MGKDRFHTVARIAHFQVLLKESDWAKENLTKGEICNKLLLATDNLGKPAWHMAVK